MKSAFPITAAALLALAGCASQGGSTASVSAPVLAQQSAAFQQVCGVLPRTGNIASVRAAAIQQGFKPAGTAGGHAFSFRKFEVLDNGAGLQVNLSNTATPLDMTGRQAMCAVIGSENGGSEASFKAAATAFATSQGVTNLAKRPYMSMDESGKLEYQTENRIVRFDWQDRPYGLVVYTLKK